MAFMGISAASLLVEYNFPGDVPGGKPGSPSRQGQSASSLSRAQSQGAVPGSPQAPAAAAAAIGGTAAATHGATGTPPHSATASTVASASDVPREGSPGVGSPKTGRRVSTAFAPDVKGGAGAGTPSSSSRAGASGGVEESKEFMAATELVFLHKAGEGEPSAAFSPDHGHGHGQPARARTATTAGGTPLSSAGLGNTAPPPACASPSKPTTAAKPGTGASGAPTTPGTAGSKGSHWLTTRMLLPYYKFDDVTHFLEIFAKVDENFSGDLDMDEWTGLFQGLSSNIPANEARSIFMKFKNDNGFLTVKELVPIVFNKANKQQQRYIITFCNEQIIRKSEGLVQLTFNEVEQLFEAFDTQNLGYVAVSYIREQFRNLPLPEAIISSALLVFKNIDDAEMISPAEFNRFFRMYISKQELLAAKQAELKEKMRIS
jgi:Ca2+-binding EF-hand superfamily protein